MNERIRELAREAGFYANPDVEKFEKFATLVAAAEREACAAICDTEADEFGGMSDGFYAAKNCASSIRARGGE